MKFEYIINQIKEFFNLGKFKDLISDLSNYQFNVMNMIKDAMYNKHTNLCTGLEALETLKKLHLIKNNL